jgi:hypothetical protein
MRVTTVSVNVRYSKPMADGSHKTVELGIEGTLTDSSEDWREAQRDIYTCGTCGWGRDLAIDKPLPQAKDDVETDRVGIEDGCDVSQSCFTCPLPDCLWETPTTRRAYLWDQTALALFEQYKYLGTAKAAAAAAKELTVTVRTIYRALKRRAA